MRRQFYAAKLWQLPGKSDKKEGAKE